MFAPIKSINSKSPKSKKILYRLAVTSLYCPASFLLDVPSLSHQLTNHSIMEAFLCPIAFGYSQPFLHIYRQIDKHNCPTFTVVRPQNSNFYSITTINCSISVLLLHSSSLCSSYAPRPNNVPISDLLCFAPPIVLTSPVTNYMLLYSMF